MERGLIWCLHGAVGMAEDWDAIAESLERSGWKLRAIDLWKYVEREGCTFAEFAAALCEEVRAQDDAPILLGYSLGGRLALHALLADPGLWSAGIIVSAHPGLAGEKERVIRMAGDAEWAARAFTGDWRTFFALWNRQAVLHEAGGEGLGDRRELESRRKAVARGFMEWSLGKQEDLRERLAKVSCPLCWITGERDEKFGALAAETVPVIPQAVHAVVPGAGHRVPWEARDEFVAELERFLTR